MNIGMRVRIKGSYDNDELQLTGKIGNLVDINEHNSDGDFYGVQFPGSSLTYYFWEKELEVMPHSTTE